MQYVDIIYVQISENGVIIVTNATKDSKSKQTLRYPDSLSRVRPNALGDPLLGGVIAPFWADNHHDSRFHKVCIHNKILHLLSGDSPSVTILSRFN